MAALIQLVRSSKPVLGKPRSRANKLRATIQTICGVEPRTRAVALDPGGMPQSRDPAR
jgi:hypothetical protein